MIDPPLPRTLAGFRGRHAGETIVVCGCGSSLSELRAPGRFVTVGVNDVGRLFDPTYLVVLNPSSQFRGDRFRYVKESRARALFTQLDLGVRHPHVVRFRLGRRGGTTFQDPNVLHYTSNSPYVALCLAVHLGAARIGLIGVDFTDHHFFADTGRHVLSRKLAAIDGEYGRLVRACADLGVEVFNLSERSRLTAIPKRDLESFETKTTGHVPRRDPMKRLAVEQRGTGIVGDFLTALADGAHRVGWRVRRIRPRGRTEPGEVAVVWNGRGLLRSGPTLFCEHAWLPRWDYQVSPSGINAGSHIAPFRWDGRPLPPEDKEKLDARLDEIRGGGPQKYAYMQTAASALEDLPEEFLLVPLQMEGDTNIQRHVPSRYRRMQNLVDDVARSQPPWPVIYKQHPADASRGHRHLSLQARRRQDAIWPHDRGNIHQILKSGRCRGIVSLNSNVVHDGMLWGVPSVVLGANVWPRVGRGPFLTALPADWTALAREQTDPEAAACRDAYAWHLIRNQWSIQDMSDPQRMEQLLSLLPGQSRPAALRPMPAAWRRRALPVAALRRV